MRWAIIFLTGWIVAPTTAQAQPKSTSITQPARGELRVSTDFPGGAARIIEIDQAERVIRFEPPEFPQGGMRSWWYFKVEGVKPGENLTLRQEFGKARARRASYSLDNKSWRFTELAERPTDESPSIFRQRVEGETAWFAWYPPYLLEHAQNLVDRAAKTSPHAEAFSLCRSEKGRSVPAVRVTERREAADSPPPGEAVWIHARQHAWETGGSWTAHGLVEWLISDDPRAAALRGRAEIYVTPIMDVDSVEQGAGGKWQDPHDHNRDWTDKPHWKAVEAAMAQARRLDDAGRLALMLDLHDNTWIGGFEFWCNPYPVMKGLRRQRTDQFLAACKGEMKGPLVFDPEVYSPYTIDTPTCGNWSSQRTRDGVVGGTCEIGLSPSLEYEGPIPEPQLIAGKELGLAIERYLRERK